jgi:hypothetical protein
MEYLKQKGSTDRLSINISNKLGDGDVDSAAIKKTQKKLNKKELNKIISNITKNNIGIDLSNTRKTLNQALYAKSNGVIFSNGGKIVGKAVTELQYNLISSSNSVDVNGSFTIELIISNINTNTRSDILTQYPYTIRGVDGSDVNNNLKGKFVPGTNMVINFTINENLIENKTFIISLDGYDVSATVSLNVIETYDLSAPIEVDEGDVITVDLSTQGVDVGSQVSYRIEGVSSSDISGASLTGSFTIDENGNAQKTFNVTEDTLTEGPEVFILKLDNNEDEVNVNIVDTSRTPSYSLDVDNSIVNETDNQIFTVTLVTENVNAGERIYYTMSGPGIEVNDFVGLTSLKGYFEVGTTDTITFTVKEDFISEGNENILFSLDNNNDSITITIQDTSTPTYDLTSTSPVNEGDVITVNLATQGLSNGTIVPYRIEGISSSDISGASLTGSFTIGANGNAQKTFNVTEDRLSDGDETFRLSIVGVNEYVDVTIIDTSKTPGFTLQSNIETVDETVPTNVVVITLITENTLLGEAFDYTISGDSITPDDFTGLASLNGIFTVDANGRDTVTLTINEDFITENNETLILALDNGQAQKSIIINDTSIETYDLTRNVASVDEGEDIIITLTTRGVIDNTLIPYTITGVSSNDIEGVNTSGNFIVVNNTATATFTTTEDLSPIEDGFKENVEIFTLTLDNIGETISVDINDTSVQTFELIPDVLSVNEGDQVTITLNTQGLSDGNVVPYTISGDGITSDDFTGLDSLDGTFTVIDNTASVILNISNDITNEGPETFSLSLDNGGASTDPITINDTSVETFTLNTDKLYVNKGGTVTITLTTQGVANDVTVSYTIVGTDITTSDFVGLNSLSGDFTVINNTAEITFNTSQDFIDSEIKSFKLVLNNKPAETDDITIGNLQMTAHQIGSFSDTDIPGEDIGGDFVSLNSTGDIIAIGDYYYGSATGAVRIYQNINNDNWVLLGDPIIGEEWNSFSGKVLSLNDSGDRIAIGVPMYNNGISETRIYQYIDGAWLKLGDDILLENDSSYDLTVYLSGDGKRVAIGAPLNDIGGIDSGVTRIHEYIDNNWVQVGNDIYGGSSDESGACVSMNTQGNRIAIGSADKGSKVYEYDDNIGDWIQLGSNPWGNFDTIKINANGNRIVITRATPSYTLAFVYEYDTSSADWVQLGSTINAKEGYLSDSSVEHGGVDINAVGNRVVFGEKDTRIFEYIDGDWIQIVPDIVFPGKRTFSNTASLNSNGDIIALGIPGYRQGANTYISLPLVEIYKITSEPFILLADDSTVTAGTSITVTLNTDQNIVDDTLVPYTISGAVITSSDLGLSDLTGNFTVNSNTASITLNVAADAPAGEILITLDGTSVDCVITIPEAPTANWIQLGSDIDGAAAEDYSGNVSINATGDRVAIGADHHDGINGIHSGHTRIYEYSGSGWIQLGSDIDGEAAEDYSGGTVSLNAAGTRVAIGARLNSGNGPRAGHTRIYEYSSGSWIQLGSDIDGAAAGDYNGDSVSLNAAGDRVAIGATQTGSSAYGYTRIYEYDGTNWIQLGSRIDGEAAGHKNGHSVSMNNAGDRVAIGSVDNSADAGHTRIYEYDDTNWVQLGLDIDGEAAEDHNAYRVSLNAAGTRVAIGAFRDGINGIQSGHTRIYEYSGSGWIQLGSDIRGEAAGDFSGFSVSMNAAGDRVAIGATFNDGNGIRSGHTRIYKYSGGSWVQLASDIDGEAAEDYSGDSVSLNAAGDRVAIGARNNNGINGNLSGHTRIYELP